MGAEQKVRLVWGLAAVLVGAAALPACGPARHPLVSVGPAAPPSVPIAPSAVPFVAKGTQIAKIALERWRGGGPVPTSQVEHLVLRRPDGSDPWEAQQFARLSDWLERSGFFSRPHASEEKRGVIMLDPSGLVITVLRGGRTFEVRNLGGQRDDELWETEMMIRGTDAAMRRHRKFGE